MRGPGRPPGAEAFISARSQRPWISASGVADRSNSGSSSEGEPATEACSAVSSSLP